jgi:hypothetical protein
MRGKDLKFDKNRDSCTRTEKKQHIGSSLYRESVPIDSFSLLSLDQGIAINYSDMRAHIHVSM